ncbi:MAG TPA: hypothetical protein ENI76_02815 [Ignavibacteria bacterium]|nr:hypothetical protein [Ignavibacteria bacterium]
MKIWFKNNDPTKVISFEKTVGEPDETSFESDITFKHGFNPAFYDIANGTLIPKTQTVVDALKAQEVTIDNARKVVKANRVANLKAQLRNKTRSQLSAYIDSKVADPGTAGVLKNITLLLKDLEEEME